MLHRQRKTWNLPALRIGAVAGLILLVAVVLAACGGSDDNTSSGETGATEAGATEGGAETSSEPLVLGNLEVPPAGGGPDFTKGVKVAEKKINDEGGVGGRMIEVRTSKAGLDSQATLQAYRNAAGESDVLAVWVGASGLAIKAQASQVKLPAFISVGNTESFIPPDPYTFSTSFGSEYATSAVTYGVEKLGVSKIGVLHYETDFSNGLTPAVEEACEALGCEVTTEQKGDIEASVEGLIPQLTALRDSGADAYYIESLNPNGMKAARQLGMFDKPILTEQWLTVPPIAEATGKAGEGVIFGGGKCRAPEVLNEDDPAKAWCENYKEEVEAMYPGEEFPLFSQYGFDTVTLFAAAAKRLIDNDEEVTRESIQRSLEEFDASEQVETSQGIVTSSPEKHVLTGRWEEAYVNYTLDFPNGELNYVLAPKADPAGAKPGIEPFGE